MFNVTHFMVFIIAINLIQHCMINEYKHLGDFTELSIWRSQQSYTLVAPLYAVALIRGTAAAWGIAWRRLDKSYSKSDEHGPDVVKVVTIWVTCIWLAFIFTFGFASATLAHQWLIEDSGDKIQNQCLLGALCMLGLTAVMVWE